MRTIVALALSFTLFWGGNAVYAQTPDSTRTVRARVVLIAGADLHLELSTSPLLQPGDTLVLRQTNRVQGALIVIAADTARAVVQFARAPFALTRGTLLEAELHRTRGAQAQSDSIVTPVAPARAAPVVQMDTSTRPLGERRVRPRASGSITSETRWIRQRTGTATESYGIPASTVVLRVDHLPGEASLHVFAHADHYGGPSRAPPHEAATQVRVYSARIDSEVGPLRLAAGRLTSAHDPFGGPWDGVSVEAGRQLSLTAEAGWEPEHGTGAPAAKFPRVSLTTQGNGEIGATTYRGTMSALRYLDGAPAGRGSLAFSTRHSLTSGRFRLAGDLVAEKSDSGTLVMRWGGVHAALENGSRSRVHVTYRRYHGQFAVPDTLVEHSATNRVEAGGYLAVGRVALSLNATTTPGAQRRSTGAIAHLYLRELPAALEVDLSGGVWEHAQLRSMNAGVAIARSAGPFFTRGAYRLERGAERDPIVAHELEGELSLLVARRSWISAVALHSTAGTTARTQLELRLTWGF